MINFSRDKSHPLVAFQKTEVAKEEGEEKLKREGLLQETDLIG